MCRMRYKFRIRNRPTSYSASVFNYEVAKHMEEEQEPT